MSYSVLEERGKRKPVTEISMSYTVPEELLCLRNPELKNMLVIQ